MLKHSEKYWLSMEALSKSLVTVIDETDWDLVLTGDVNESLIKWEVYGNYGDVHPKEITSKKEKSSVDDKKFDESNQEKKWFLSACKEKWKPDTF